MSAIASIQRKPGRAWRVLQWAPTRILVAALAVVGSTTALQLCARAMDIKLDSGAGLFVALLLVPLACAAYMACVRWVERRPIVELDYRGAVIEFSAGALVGGGLFAATVLVLWLLDVWHFDGVRPWSALATPLALAMAAAFVEELLFRGILFRVIEETLGSVWALAVSAVIFGLMHGFNPGATVISTVAISLEAGVLLAAAYMLTRRLWLPIGLHFAWNFTESGIFGASTSGHEAHGLLISRLSGPDLLSGGAFGPEASIVAVLLCLAAGIGLLVVAARRDHIVAPIWRRK